MPNHCENDLRVTGDKKELSRFKEFAKDKKELLSADKFIPYPEKFKKQDEEAEKWDKTREKYKESLVKKGMNEDKARENAWKDFPSIKSGFSEGGYDWCIKNWGTKWGFYEVELREQDEELFYTFQTAWSPAEPVIKKMGEMFPKLTFDLRYFEQGMGFNGILNIKKGKVIMKATGEYFGDRGG